MNATQAIHGLLSDALKSGEVHVLGEALELSPATRGLLAAAPEHVHLLPAADATLIGVGIGIALSGARPVIELSGPDALWGILQQLGQEAAPLRGAGEFSAPVVIRVPTAPGQGVPVEPIAALDGVILASPSSAAEAAGILKAALRSRDPVVILEPRELLSGGIDAIPDITLGRASIARQGDHVTALAWGRGVTAALEAAETLEAEGISVEVLDLRTLSPLDLEAIAASVRKTGRPVLVDCPASVRAAVVTAAFLRLESPPISTSADPSALAGAVRQSVSY